MKARGNDGNWLGFDVISVHENIPYMKCLTKSKALVRKDGGHFTVVYIVSVTIRGNALQRSTESGAETL